jgi:hypothetical protein
MENPHEAEQAVLLERIIKNVVCLPVQIPLTVKTASRCVDCTPVVCARSCRPAKSRMDTEGRLTPTGIPVVLFFYPCGRSAVLKLLEERLVQSRCGR